MKPHINLNMDCQSDSDRMERLGNLLEYVVLVRRVRFAERPVQSVCMMREFGQEFDSMQPVVSPRQVSCDHYI